MPIVIRQLIPINNAHIGYAVAKELARQQVAHLSAVRGAGAAIGTGSCCATIALTANTIAGFPAALPLSGFGVISSTGNPAPAWEAAALPYSVAYGNSQMVAGGLVLGPVAGHAERNALIHIDSAALNLFMIAPDQAVLYVELEPCTSCNNWLNGTAGPGTIANPFDGIVNGAGNVTLNVWYRWSYPGLPALPAIGTIPALMTPGTVAMNTFHALPLPAQLADINGPTW